MTDGPSDRYYVTAMTEDQRDAVAALIRDSTNHWYESHARPPIFTGDPGATRLFVDVYEALDPGRCLVAVERESRMVVGSCFYHPRTTHVSLGIMNVHPDHFGRGVARMLLTSVTNHADTVGLPTRLVSSALNLDSFSLYTRAGFVPRAIYQDMIIPDPTRVPEHPPAIERVRPATPDDVHAIADLEQELTGVRREADYRYFVDNPGGIWRTLVLPYDGRIDGMLVSVKHDASHMLGPGCMRDDTAALALIAAQLRSYPDSSPVFLVPANHHHFVNTLYAWGARNCELHLAQVRGTWREPAGVTMPTFMPETG